MTRIICSFPTSLEYQIKTRKSRKKLLDFFEKVVYNVIIVFVEGGRNLTDRYLGVCHSSLEKTIELTTNERI